MKLTDASKYRFTYVDEEGQVGGAHPLDGDIMPIREARGDGSDLVLSYEDMCFLQEAVGELWFALRALANEDADPRDGTSEQYPVSRIRYGAEVGRVSFNADEPMLKAGYFGGSYIAPAANDTSHSDLAEAYLESAGTDVNKLFPYAMTMSARSGASSSLDLVYVGSWLESAWYGASPWYDALKCLLSLAWSEKMQVAPRNTYAYSFASDTLQKAVLDYTNGYTMDYSTYSKQNCSLHYPCYVNPSVTPVSSATVVLTVTRNYDSMGAETSARYMAANGAETYTTSGGSSLTRQDQVRLMSQARRMALGLSGPWSGLDNAGLSNTRFGRWSFEDDAGNDIGKDIHGLLTDRTPYASVIKGLFELPPLCTKVFIPQFEMYAPSSIATKRTSAQQSSSQQDGEVEYTGPSVSTYDTSSDSLSSALFNRERRISVTAYGKDAIYLFDSYQSINFEEVGYGADTPTLRLLQSASAYDQETALKGLVGTIRAVCMFDVEWKQNTTTYSPDTGATLSIARTEWRKKVAVPLTFTRKATPTVDSNTAEWTCDKTVDGAFDAAIAAAPVPVAMPTFAEAQSQIAYNRYVPSQSYTSVSYEMNVGFNVTTSPVSPETVIFMSAFADVTPWTADQTAE